MIVLFSMASAITVAAFGIYVFIKRANSILNKIFVFVCATAFLDLIGNAIYYPIFTNPNVSPAQLSFIKGGWLIMCFGLFFQPAAYFYFCLVRLVPKFMKKYRFIPYIICIPSVFLVLIAIFYGWDAFYYANRQIKPLYFIHIIYFACSIIIIEILTLRRYAKSHSNTERKQLLLLFLFLAAATLEMIIYQFVKAFFSIPYPIDDIAIMILFVGFYITVTKHNLLGLLEFINYEHLFDTASDIIITVNSRLQVEKENISKKPHLGYHKLDLLSKPINEILSLASETEERPLDAHDFHRFSESNEKIECILIDKQSNKIAVHIHITSIKSYIDELLGYNIICTDIRTLKQFEFESRHDSLTGLYNRKYFDDQVARISANGETKIGILICDVDGLKLVNDTMGHLAGDALIKSAAFVIRKVTQSFTDSVVTRTGGDEFAVFLHNATESKMAMLKYGIIAEIETQNLSPKAGQEKLLINLSISMGYAIYEGGAENLHDAFIRADAQMYRQKLFSSSAIKEDILCQLYDYLRLKGIIYTDLIKQVESVYIDFCNYANCEYNNTDKLKLFVKYSSIGLVHYAYECERENTAAIPYPMLIKHTSPERFAKYSEIGYRIALSVPSIAQIADLILKGDEKWNGTGSLLRLNGTEIPFECRTLFLINSFFAEIQAILLQENKQAYPNQFDLKNIERDHPSLITNVLEILKNESGKAYEKSFFLKFELFIKEYCAL